MKLATLIVLAGALLVAGCDSGSNQAVSTAATTVAPPSSRTTGTTTRSASGCQAVPAQLLARIRRNVVLAGARLETASAVTSSALPGFTFVSAHVSGGGAAQHAVATWVTTRLDGHGAIYSLDAFAALISQFGAGVSSNPDLTASAPGVSRSRVCAAGSDAPPAETAPPSGGGGGRPR